VIVAALELEAMAAREHVKDVVDEVHQNGTVYFAGHFGGEDPWRVAIVIAGAGNPTAALELERAVQWFKPRVVMLVGVAGGIKDVALPLTQVCWSACARSRREPNEAPGRRISPSLVG
jgi:nucleoside phosphorylase